MITPSYSATATERILPRMALDFTTASLDSRVTLTRALDTATRINSSGLIEAVNANLPRFDYTLNSGGACKGLLIEEARTNYATYSNNLTNPVWVATNITSSMTATGPDGVVNSATTITASANNATILQSITDTSNARITSCYIKRRTGSGVINMTQNNGTTWSPVTVTSDWTRVNIASATLANPVIGLQIASNGDAVDVWCFQNERGAFVTSAIPTTATSLTRNADIAVMSGANFSSWYNASAGMFVVDADIIGFNANNMLLAVSDSGTTNLIQQYLVGATTSRFLVRTSGSDQAAMDNTVSASAVFRIASAYAANNFATASNGGAIQTDTVGTVPTVDRLGIGSRIGSLVYNGHICAIRYYPMRPTNAEVQAFSKQ